MHAKKELWEGQGNCIKVKHCRKSHFTSTREGEKGEKVNVQREIGALWHGKKHRTE